MGVCFSQNVLGIHTIHITEKEVGGNGKIFSAGSEGSISLVGGEYKVVTTGCVGSKTKN